MVKTAEEILYCIFFILGTVEIRNSPECRSPRAKGHQRLYLYQQSGSLGGHDHLDLLRQIVDSSRHSNN